MVRYQIHKTEDNLVPLKFHVECKSGEPFTQLKVGCVHWDNPKSDHNKLLNTLSYAKKKGYPVQIGGDFFCAMQGKWDKRSSKSDLRPEHQEGNYLDRLVYTAADFLSPYADIISMICLGNHETAILNKHETNLTERLVTLLNRENGTNIAIGGYRGWVLYSFYPSSIYNKGLEQGFDKVNKHMSFTKHQYFIHGWGGGGPVTKGVINTNRIQDYVKADFITMEHVHERYNLTRPFVFLNRDGREEVVECEHIRTPTFKEEFLNQNKGWHIERGAAPKPIGGTLIHIIPYSKNNNYHAYIDTNKATGLL